MIPICVLSEQIDWDALDTEDFMDGKKFPNIKKNN